MATDTLPEVLKRFKRGDLSEKEVLAYLQALPFTDLGFAKVDHHRTLRHGFPEVIFGLKKTEEEILSIAKNLLERQDNLLITEATQQVSEKLKNLHPECKFYPRSRVLSLVRNDQEKGFGLIGVVSAGTADMPVAEAASVTASAMGNRVFTTYDCGVAGLHRVLSVQKKLSSCSVVIAVAGMEGALPSVIGGLVPCPVIAVPTSVGYGAALGGITALLGMLTSCSSNVTTVNIDNGFGAGYVASLINRKRESDGHSHT
jgi:NCAIR mutase (PurE)-related protein